MPLVREQQGMNYASIYFKVINCHMMIIVNFMMAPLSK